MILPAIPENEKQRLKELYEYDILDSEPEEDFDEIVKMASAICNTPISLITLIDAERQWFKSKTGVNATETDRSISFCSHAILGDEIFIVPDATTDERFHDNPFVTDSPDVRFYAGVPLLSPAGYKMGSLCVIDTVPRELTEHQRDSLLILSRQTVKLMELRKRNHELKNVSEQEREQRKELQRISSMQNRITSILAHDLRGPLGALKSLLTINLPEEKFKEMASGQLEITLGLIDNIVEWGQLQIANKTVTATAYPLKELVQKILDGCSMSASLKSITLVNKVDPSVNISIDEYALRFILRNLLTNSIKFTKSGYVYVFSELLNGQLNMTVKDTGIGMKPEMSKILFEGSRKTSRNGTDNESGSGLGLSLIKEFIDKSKGTITVESAPGLGTTIMFSLHLSDVK